VAEIPHRYLTSKSFININLYNYPIFQNHLIGYKSHKSSHNDLNYNQTIGSPNFVHPEIFHFHPKMSFFIIKILQICHFWPKSLLNSQCKKPSEKTRLLPWEINNVKCKKHPIWTFNHLSFKTIFRKLLLWFENVTTGLLIQERSARAARKALQHDPLWISKVNWILNLVPFVLYPPTIGAVFQCSH